VGGTAAFAYDAWRSERGAALAATAAEAAPPRGLSRHAKPARSESAVKSPQAGAPADPAAAQLAETQQQLAAAQRPLAPSPEEAARQRQRELEIAEQDRRRSAEIEADRQARAQRRARAGLSVTMYATSWCPACKAARGYMTEQQIAFVEHDIEASQSAKLIMKRLNPRGGVPTLDVDGTVLVGFSSAEIDAAVEAAVLKRTASSR
jgi:glutaredoxin